MALDQRYTLIFHPLLVYRFASSSLWCYVEHNGIPLLHRGGYRTSDLAHTRLHSVRGAFAFVKLENARILILVFDLIAAFLHRLVHRFIRLLLLCRRE